MALKDEILRELLSADDYISGEYLAGKYNKSRAGVWKAIKAIRAMGYTVDAVTNKGYIITDKADKLGALEIKARLKSDIDVLYYQTIDSTNNECKRLLGEEKKGVFLVVAEEQSAGRGRQGKSFHSPKETGVYFSLVIRPRAELKNAVTATTAAAVAVCSAVESLTDLKPEIKWVNDVYLNGNKICGILTEAITNFEEGIVESVIIGIGININTIDFPDDVSGAGCLGVKLDRNELIAAVVNELYSIAYCDYDSFINYYRSHSMVIGKRIKYIRNGEVKEGTAVQIDERGGLVVRHSDGSLKTLISGEITIRTL